MRQIGRRTGELQTRLREPPRHRRLRARADRAGRYRGVDRAPDRARRAHVFDLLAKSAAGLAEAEQRAGRPHATARSAIADHIRNSLPATVGAVKIRHHGDFHLGQVLIAKDDAFILDFEGEPRRRLAERRAKAPAARDVAGLIRSIDYATTAALANARQPHARGSATSSMPQTANVARTMAAEDSGEPTARRSRTRRCGPPMPWQAQNLLDFFLLEKAFYEIEYELTNRPPGCTFRSRDLAHPQAPGVVQSMSTS